jgi:hypothetical protein
LFYLLKGAYGLKEGLPFIYGPIYYYLLGLFILALLGLLIIVGPMNPNIKKKVGRPATGNVLFKKRVNPKTIPELLRLIEGDKAMSIPTDNSNGLESKGTADYGPIVAASYKELSDGLKKGCVDLIKPDVEAALLKREIDVLKEDNRKLLDSIGGYEKDLAYWRERFEKAVQATEHQMAAYWKERANKAELALRAKGGEFDQG